MDFRLYYDECSWFVMCLSRQMGSFSRAVRVSFSWPLRHRTTRTTVRTTPREPIGLPSLAILYESVYVCISGFRKYSYHFTFKFKPFAKALVVKALSLLFLFYIAQSNLCCDFLKTTHFVLAEWLKCERKMNIYLSIIYLCCVGCPFNPHHSSTPLLVISCHCQTLLLLIIQWAKPGFHRSAWN